jgi:hypothetical protein
LALTKTLTKNPPPRVQVREASDKDALLAAPTTLAHATGRAAPTKGSVVVDPQFPTVRAPEAVALKRTVEQRQWKEVHTQDTKKNAGGRTTTTHR